MKYLIHNASVVNEGEVFRADVLVEDGDIRRIVRDGHPGIEAERAGTDADAAKTKAIGNGATVIDAGGKYLIPGVIDEHVHFREPGLTHKADIFSESRSAVAGGVTSFMDMPNTVPQTTTKALLEEKFDIASQNSLANHSFYIGATDNNLREILSTDFSSVCGVKLFLGSSTGNMLVSDGGALEDLFREAPCLIAAHCEDEGMIRADTQRCAALVKEGKLVPDASIHPLMRSSKACYTATERAVDLARRTGARLHVLHISSAEELSLFDADIPLENKKISAETCPHYLLLDSSRYGDLSYAIKCNPAIKSPEDREALLKALKGGKIDTIGSDHAPHLREEKFTGDCFTSKSGFPSIQHSLELMYSLTLDGRLELTDLVKLMCHNPALLYRIKGRGFIREGYRADLVLLDPHSERVITDEDELSKCGWSPYNGTKVHCRVSHTFINGNLVYEDGIFHEGFRGERLAFGL